MHHENTGLQSLEVDHFLIINAYLLHSFSMALVFFLTFTEAIPGISTRWESGLIPSTVEFLGLVLF